MKEIYRNWQQSDSVERFANKAVCDFFRSETYFLEKIGKELNSVLDVGCASGRFIELIQKYNHDIQYTGIDLVQESIELGQKYYPNADFFVASAQEFETDKKFDLVNATGVFQHEPKFDELLHRMIRWSEKYILFDIKAAAIEHHLIDIEKSYCESDNDRMYFNVMSWTEFKQQLLQLRGIESVMVLGYETKPNKVTTVPESALPFASMGVLLRKGKGKGKPVLEFSDIPSFLDEGITDSLQKG
jgi:SAM-dependent methyltransferase